jgi:hypothetical protein
MHTAAVQYEVLIESRNCTGMKFLVQKTVDELNACEVFREFMPANQRLSVELCRQKIKEFQTIAVNTPDADIDRRVLMILFQFYCSTFIHKYMCLWQVVSNGKSTSNWCTKKNNDNNLLSLKKQRLEFKIGNASMTTWDPSFTPQELWANHHSIEA